VLSRWFTLFPVGEGVFSRRFHCATFGERMVLSSSSPVLRRTLEEGFASSSSVAPNSPVRASGSFNRFGCLRVHCFPDRSIVFRNFLDPDENVDRCSYPRFGKGEEFYYDWVRLRRGRVLLRLGTGFLGGEYHVFTFDCHVQSFFFQRRYRGEEASLLLLKIDLASEERNELWNVTRYWRCRLRKSRFLDISKRGRRMENHKLMLFNSMSKQKEVFKTRVEGQVSMYVCSIMPYDLSHIGHTRAYVAFDVLHRTTSNAMIISCQNLCITLSISRYLKHLGYEVKYVRNFTDIDDKVRSLFTLSC
ncbi:hypothetical protein B296_00037631, partial [Ensete ventricosum]